MESIGTEIRFVGLKRSGNHAILNWLLRQRKGSVAFFNDVRPEAPYEASRLVGATSDDLREVDTATYSIEDTSLAVIADRHAYPRRDAYPGLRVGRRLDVLLLRDPFNLFASRFRRGAPWGSKALYINGISAPQMWVTYALESVGRTRWLEHDCVTIDYNRWCSSREYRRELARTLDLEFTDEGFTEVTGFGGGSSFESTSQDGSADRMQTDRRWTAFAEDPDFLRLFEDPLLLDLACEIFDLDEETQDFVERLRPRSKRSSALRRRWASAVGQRAVARLRRSRLARAAHRLVTARWRVRSMPVKKPG